MKFSAALLVLIATNAIANTKTWDHPTRPFDATVNMYTSVSLKWKVVKDVQKECEVESKNRSFNGFGYTVNACAFWEGNSCTIITSENVSMHTVGHEVRHCFQGAWH